VLDPWMINFQEFAWHPQLCLANFCNINFHSVTLSLLMQHPKEIGRNVGEWCCVMTRYRASVHPWLYECRQVDAV